MPSALRRRVTGWVAICAILLNTFAPAASHALAPERGMAWLQICSQAGVGRVLLADAGPGGEPVAPHAVAFEHCPYCAPHGGSTMGPPPAPLVAAVAVAAVGALAAPPAAASARFAWFAAPARAPPRVA